MDTPQWIAVGISGLALGVSALSMLVSWLNYNRDNPNVDARCVYIPGGDADLEENGPHLNVIVTNKGRRAIVLRVLGGLHEGHFCGTLIDSKSGGHTLEPERRWDKKVWYHDLIFTGPGDNDPTFEFNELHVEDTVGRRYPVRGSRDAIIQLLEDPRHTDIY